MEHLASAGGLHPVQEAMVERHASQCGFCTPGFVMQLYAGWRTGALTDRQSVKDVVSGNLCRCTGYGPIVDAGLAVASVPVPDTGPEDALRSEALQSLRGDDLFRYEAAGATWLSPADVDQLADTYAAHPKATLVAGATDVGLWVTKQHRSFETLIDVSRVHDLRHIEEGPESLFFGAAVTHADARARLAELHPDLGEVMRRFAGYQVRNAGTVGGNIANGSPIGDLPPVLIALGATLYLRQGEAVRRLPLEDFFLEYGKQDRREGEFVVAVEVPLLKEGERFSASKMSKRMDSDISAVLAAFKLGFEGERVVSARLAFGGMAGTPKRALAAEAMLVGRPFDEAAVRDAAAALADDFQPLSDMRASGRLSPEDRGRLSRALPARALGRSHEDFGGRVMDETRIQDRGEAGTVDPAALDEAPPAPRTRLKGGVGQPIRHDSGVKHVTGEARYTDDEPELPGTLQVFIAMSPRANAAILSMDLDPVRAAPGVACVLGAGDIPGINDYSPVFGDDPIFAEGTVHYVGQPLFAVAAADLRTARMAAKLARVEYADAPPAITIDEALTVADEAGEDLLPPTRCGSAMRRPRSRARRTVVEDVSKPAARTIST